MYRIGFGLAASRNATQHFVKAFDDGMQELGYEEGRNVVIERRFAEGNLERLPLLV